LCFYADWPNPRVDYTERRKTKRKKNSNVPSWEVWERRAGAAHKVTWYGW